MKELRQEKEQKTFMGRSASSWLKTTESIKTMEGYISLYTHNNENTKCWPVTISNSNRMLISTKTKVVSLPMDPKTINRLRAKKWECEVKQQKIIQDKIKAEKVEKKKEEVSNLTVHELLKMVYQKTQNENEKSSKVTCRDQAEVQLFSLLDVESKREQFGVLFMDSQNKLLEKKILFIGSLTGSTVYPREIFKKALLTDAYNIILCHNHPAGDPKPSAEDIALTKKIVEIGKTLEINILDHIIIAQGGTESLAEIDPTIFN